VRETREARCCDENDSAGYAVVPCTYGEVVVPGPDGFAKYAF